VSYLCYTSMTMSDKAAASPRWAVRLHELLPDVARAPTDPGRREAWQIVHFNISRYLRYHAARLGAVAPDDILDIAADKTLDLMSKTDISAGRLLELAPEEIPGYFSTVARNGLVTFLKKARRVVSETDDEEPTGRAGATFAGPAPHARAESDEYARALRGCVEKLEQRSRTLWFFRVFYEMPSKDLAAHPSVGMAASHVDVVLHRVRKTLRNCMRAHGHETRAMPPGTFVALWQLFHPVGESKEAM
jgi:DNA-directed RNA polymerase specialized sigma24 family protein